MELNLEQIIALVKEVLPEGVEISNVSTSGPTKVSIALLKPLAEGDLDLTREDFDDNGCLLPEVCDKIVNDFAADMGELLKPVEGKLEDIKLEVVPNGFSGSVCLSFDDGTLSDNFAFESSLQVLAETVAYKVGDYLNSEEDAAKLDYSNLELNKNDLSDEVPEAGLEIAPIADEEPERPDMNEEPFDEGIDFKALAEKYLGPDEDEQDELAAKLKDYEDEKYASDLYDSAYESLEDEAACEDCFAVYPKSKMIKTRLGYLCPVCDQERKSHQGTNLDLVDKDPFDLDYDDPRLPKKEKEPEVVSEPFDAKAERAHEEGIDEELKVIKDFGDYEPWSGAEDTYNKIKDAGKLEELEAWLEEIFPDGATETEINDVLWFEPRECFIACGLDSEDGSSEDVFDQDFDEGYTGNPAERTTHLEYTDDNPADGKAVLPDNIEKQLTEDEEGKDAELIKESKFADGFEDALNKEYHNRLDKYAKDFGYANGQELDDAMNADWDLKQEVIEADDGDNFLDLYLNWWPDCEAFNAEDDYYNEPLEEILGEIVGVKPYNENLEEHVNDRPADIESDQKLQGVDNAVVDCKKYTLVAHSEDEKPVDCKLEKPALEEPVAGKEVDVKLYEDVNEKPWIMQQGDNGEPEYLGFAKSQNDMLSKMVKDHRSNAVGENTYIDELDKETYEYMKEDGDLSEDEIKELDKYFGITENLEEAKKDDELPVDPEAAKLEVHTMLNDLVADEIEAINGYEEAKKEIMDTPIAHKDNILDTIDHVEDEEKEHVDELISATTEIPFDKEEAPAPVVEEPVVEEEPLNQDFPEVEENLEEKVDLPAFDSDVKVGDSILIINMEGEPDYCGRKGKVDHIDSLGQLHGTWGGLAVIPGVDKFDILTDESLKESLSDDKLRSLFEDHLYQGGYIEDKKTDIFFDYDNLDFDTWINDLVNFFTEGLGDDYGFTAEEMKKAIYADSAFLDDLRTEFDELKEEFGDFDESLK